MTEATTAENKITAPLGAVLVAGVYSDGWAHLNLGGLDSFFTPWHGVLYGGFSLLTAWLAWMVWRRRNTGDRWVDRVPRGYGWGLTGVAVFAVGGLLDMVWHTVFGIEVGIDALVSPTHLLLLTGALLMISSPLRAAAPLPSAVEHRVHQWPAVVSLAAAVSLMGFFLSYVSVFADPGPREPFVIIPEGLPEHRASELPAIAGLGGYLVFTVLLVVPLLYLRRRARLPHGTVTVLVAAIALPAAALSQMIFAVPAVAALAAGSIVDVILTIRPELSAVALAGLVPGLVWAGQLSGLAITGALRWPVELWAGVVGLTVMLSLALAWLTQPGRLEDASQPSQFSRRTHGDATEESWTHEHT